MLVLWPLGPYREEIDYRLWKKGEVGFPSAEQQARWGRERMAEDDAPEWLLALHIMIGTA